MDVSLCGMCSSYDTGGVENLKMKVISNNLILLEPGSINKFLNDKCLEGVNSAGDLK